MNCLTHSLQLTTSYPVLVCLLNTGTLFQSVMLGFNSILRLIYTVLQFHYISGAVFHSASWARGAVHIPVYSSPPPCKPPCKPAAPSSVTTTSATRTKRRYAAITSNGRHKPQPSSSLPPDGPLSKAAREQEEYQQVLEVTLSLVASLGQIPGLLQELSSSTLCSDKQTARLRKIISATAPSAGTPSSTQVVVQEILVVGL